MEKLTLTPETGFGPKVIIKADLQAMAKEAAELFIQTAQLTLEQSASFSVLLSGGKTPDSLYQRLAASPDRELLDWKRVFIFWGDERIAPATSTQSNYRMVKEALLDHVPLPRENIFRVPTELQSPERIAEAYEKTLREFFQVSLGTPGFDFVFLGLGGDGHTASLFPDSDYAALAKESDRLVIAPFVAHLQSHRISVTLNLLNAAKHILFLVGGTEKAQALKNILEPQANTPALPAQLIRPKNHHLTWIIDTPAAALLKLPPTPETSKDGK
jgi:6-phosphogluconolactonase